MNKLKFHYARAVNFRCFGPDGIELHLDDYGKVIHVQGENLDNPSYEGSPASNATGKSTLQEIISVALYGKPVKEPSKCKNDDLMNVKEDGHTIIEVQFDDYRIVRTLKKKGANKLQLWESANRVWDDESETTRGTIAKTQEHIQKLVGLTHHAFCNVVVFDDSDTYSFLEADTPTKRQIVENLLGLSKYREYHDTAKELLRDAKKKLDKIAEEYEHIQTELNSHKGRIDLVEQQETKWKTSVRTEIEKLERSIGLKQDQLSKTDAGEALNEYQQSQDQLAKLNEESLGQGEKRTKLTGLIEIARGKIDLSQQHKMAAREDTETKARELQETRSQLKKSESLIEDLDNLEEGTTCSHCHSVITADNYVTVLKHERNIIGQCKQKIQSQSMAFEKAKATFGEKSALLQKLEAAIDSAMNKGNVLDLKIHGTQDEIARLSAIQKPEAGAKERVLESEVVNLKAQLKTKQAEIVSESPYKEIMEQAVTEKETKENELTSKSAELKESEAELPYHEYWVGAFGDKGIRKFIVDGIIPALNSRIAYWMQYLIDGGIELTFNNKLEETILRNGNSAVYYSMSNGEKRRVNLAVSQAFAYVMMLNCGHCPSLVFLDEITGGGIDRAGVVGIFNMIFELAKERQVFVTTHNENLLSMLQGCETINLKKQNDITVLVS